MRPGYRIRAIFGRVDLLKSAEFDGEFAYAYQGRGMITYAQGNDSAALSDLRRFADLMGDETGPGIRALITDLETRLDD